MRCIPKPGRATAVNLIFALSAFLGLSLFASSVIFRETGNGGAWFWLRLASVAFLFGGIYVLARYRLIKFAYVIKPRDEWADTELLASYASIVNVPYYMLDFVVYKSVGAREPVVQCVLSLEDFKGMATDADRKAYKDKFIRENGAGFTTYDYTLTPWSRDRILLVFRDEDKYAGILIEPDEQMRTFFETIG